MDLLLTRCSVLVLCDNSPQSSTNPNPNAEIFGWAAVEIIDGFLIVHFLYVKRAFRDHGVGTQLIKYVLDHEPRLNGIVYTHLTKAGRSWISIVEGRPWLRDLKLTYNPFLLYRTIYK